MKKIIFLLTLLLAVWTISAQTMWNKRLPCTATTGRPISDLRYENGRVLVTVNNCILELDQAGSVTGLVKGSFSLGLVSNYISNRHLDQFQKPFFIFCSKGASANGTSAYKLNSYKSGVGFETALVLSDSLGVYHNGGPAILEPNENSLILIGRKFIRQVHISDQGGLGLDWEKPLPFPAGQVPQQAVLQNDRIYAVTGNGRLIAFDLAGNLLWDKGFQNGYVFNQLAATGDGLVICGKTIDGVGMIVKTNFDGDFVWENSFGDLNYLDILTQSDGSFICTGSTEISDTAHIVLLQADAAGTLLWKKSHQAGTGSRLVQTQEGGFVILGNNLGAVYGIKTTASGQTIFLNDEIIPVREREIRNDHVSLSQNPASSLFFNGNFTSLHIPADSNTSTVFTHSPWIAGLDVAQNLDLSAGTYGESIGSDFRMGISTGAMEDFNRLWKITRKEIQAIRQDFGVDGKLDEPVPFDLETWPARGNPYFTQNLDFSLCTTNPDSFPAPFVDHNGDGKYNVFDGDYPKIIGDQMLWWVITDKTEHQESNGGPLEIDLLISVHIFECNGNETISKTVFTDYQMISRSVQNYKYTDAYFGFYTDFDLGCGEDDYIGSLPSSNSVYAYNIDDLDGYPGASCAAGVETFGTRIPVQSVTMLNQSLNHVMVFNRTGTNNYPTAPSEYYQLLKSHWPDGTPLTIGGDGYNPTDPNAIPTSFSFFGNPVDPAGWSMCSENIFLGDRLTTSSHGPFTFNHADTFNMQLAFIFHPDIPHPCPDIETWVKPTIDQIREWHQDGTLNPKLDLGGVLNLTSGQSILLDATQADPNTGYLWSTSQTTASITVNQLGLYTVTVYPASGCAYEETVLVKSASGTHSPASPLWQLQPNPASDLLRLSFEQYGIPDMIQLCNAQGQLVLEKTNQEQIRELSVAALPAGLYWVELWRENRFLGSKKVVVVR